jgi:hypothetical protein
VVLFFGCHQMKKNQRQESVLEIKRIRAAKAFLICVPERLMYIHGIFYAGTPLPMQHPFGARDANLLQIHSPKFVSGH